MHPHVNLLKIAPLIVASNTNINPNFAERALNSSYKKFCERKNFAAKNALVKNAITATHAVGMWKNIILASSPIPLTGGTKKITAPAIASVKRIIIASKSEILLSSFICLPQKFSFDYIKIFRQMEESIFTAGESEVRIAKKYFGGCRMKFVSWNVNGLRACLKKNFMDAFKILDADIFAVQETRMLKEQAIIDLNGYAQFWNSAEKKGYSGTAIFTRLQPISATYGINIEEHDHEGRVITLEFANFYFVNVYVPNSRRNLERLEYRLRWEDDFRNYLKNLDAAKPVIICGDLNVAHNEIDLSHPAANRGNSGFTDEERGKFGELLNAGFVDSFRFLYPDRKNIYSWWSNFRNAREKNIGWRIDYFLVSKNIADKITAALIEDKIFGSDHCPVTLEAFNS